MKLIHRLLRYWGHIRFIPFGIRNRLLRRLHPVGTELAFIVPFNGNWYKGNTKSYIDWHVFFYGTYELELLRMIEKILKKIHRPIVLDIGANVGHHTLYLSSHAFEIHAFEPFPDFCKEIAEKVKLNNLTNIHIHNFGLSDVNASMKYYAPDDNQANKGVGSFIENYNTGLVFYSELKLVKGDDIIDLIGLSGIHLIKIDVEGLELEVLRGLQIQLSKYRPIIIMEFTKNTANRIKTLEALTSALPDKYLIKEINFNKRTLLNNFSFETCKGDIICFDESAWSIISDGKT